MRLLLDADATLALSKLSIWKLLLASQVRLAMTGFVAKHELSSIWSAELEPLVTGGRIALHEVKAKTDAWARWRELRAAGADKGEAEAIAWALGEPPNARPWFVSLDGKARDHAKRAGVEALDVADLAGLLIARGALTELAVAGKLAVWDDSRQQPGRPKNWESVKSSLPPRIARMQKA